MKVQCGQCDQLVPTTDADPGTWDEKRQTWYPPTHDCLPLTEAQRRITEGLVKSEQVHITQARGRGKSDLLQIMIKSQRVMSDAELETMVRKVGLSINQLRKMST